MSNPNKPFHGRAIYQPSGAAGEYSQWACNLFNGCTNRCTYCYNRHSMTAKVLGADEVTMKKSLLNVPTPKKEQFIGTNGEPMNPTQMPIIVAERDHLSLGFTLTGMDHMERHCISNTQERIDAMKWAHEQGIHTWASIEPVIDYQMALDVITCSLPYCREYRIGLASKLGIKYDPSDVRRFVECVSRTIGDTATLIWKQSVLNIIT